MTHQKTLYLIDGNSLVYRAFYAIPPFTTTKGFPTNAIYGFTKMLLKIMKEKQPDYIAVVFDAKGPTFRTEVFEQYKAQRPKMPDQLVMQRPYIRKMVEALNIPLYEIQGIEADDVIGTFVHKYARHHLKIVIVTGDKDLMQLVEEGKVEIYDTMKDMLYGRQEVLDKMGVYPEHIIDLLSLMGDVSDNIPGVHGIGPKTALKLLQDYKTLDGVYKHLDSITGAVQEKLKNDRELAYISYQLATIKTDVPLDISLDDLVGRSPHMDQLAQLCDELEFTSLKKDLSSFGSFDHSLYQLPKKVHEKRYVTVENQTMFDSIIKEIKKAKSFAFDTETTSLNPFEARLVGISLSFATNIGYYVPLQHKSYTRNLDLAYVLKEIFSLLDDTRLRKYGHNMKFDISVLEHEQDRIRHKSVSVARQSKKQMNLF